MLYESLAIVKSFRNILGLFYKIIMIREDLEITFL